jgi:hypothetical protein
MNKGFCGNFLGSANMYGVAFVENLNYNKTY